jgi:hypothetical protein
MIDWEEVGKAYKEMEKSDKMVFATLDDGKEYFVWSLVAEDKEINILPVSEMSFGSLEEMICDSYALVVAEEGMEAETFVEKILDLTQHVSAKFAEIKSDDPDTVYMKIWKVGEPMPEDATGRFLKFNYDTDQHEYID